MLYTGTFEAYQGLDLLFAAMAHRARARGPTRGSCSPAGSRDQIDAARAQARAAGIGDAVDLRRRAPGRRDSRVSLDAADVLVSPRAPGTNTPLKIYQYLRSGRPIVATRLLTHTQVLNDESAILTGATPDGFADGILAALDDPSARGAVGAQRAGAGRDEIQLRGVPRADAPGLRRT